MNRITSRQAALAVPVRRATTTLIVRDGPARLEVLMVRRSLQASFMPGSYVFPGGAVDTGDVLPAAPGLCDEDAATLEQRLGRALQLADGAAAHALAGLRECFEECGLWLGAAAAEVRPAADWAALRRQLHGGATLAALAAGAGLVLRTSSLRPWARWVTPLGAPRRFDTVFVVAPAPADQAPEVDAGETTALAWVEPAQVLQPGSGVPLEFATRAVLQTLLPFSGTGDATGTAALLRHAETLRDLAPVHPRLDFGPDGSVRRILMPGDAGYDEAGPAQP